VCEKDEYLLTLVRYIHLNPIRAKLVQKLDDYPYCGHREYCGARASEVLEPSRVLEMRRGRARYRRFVREGLKDGHRADYYDVIDQRFLGEERFVEKLKVQADEEVVPPRPKKIERRLSHCCTCRHLEPEVLSGADRSWRASRYRALAGYVLIRRLGYKLKDVAKFMGRDVATVSSLVSRYSDRMAEHRGLKKQAAQIAKNCLGDSK
jgi:putative transposase